MHSQTTFPTKASEDMSNNSSTKDVNSRAVQRFRDGHSNAEKETARSK